MTTFRKAGMSVIVALLMILHPSSRQARAGLPEEPVDIAKLRAEDAQQEFRALQAEIKYFSTEAPGWERLRRETLRQSALTLHASEPCSLVVGRIRNLIQALEAMPGGPNLKTEHNELRTLVQNVRPADLPLPQQQALFAKLCDLRRRIAFKNPLLNFDRIIFLKRHHQARGDGHMVDQFLGFNAREGGGVYVLSKAFSDQPAITNLLDQAVVGNGRLKGQKLDKGAFLSLELDFDARTIVFAWTQAQHQLSADADWSRQPWTKAEADLTHHPHYYWSPERTYHVFKAAADGSGLTQLTDGPSNDYDPCFLPSGRIVFISERCGGVARCGGRWSPSAVLHCMMGDGSDIVPISFHETNEWQPSIDHNGMLVYTRWDYVDRGSAGIHHLWTCYPDGRDPRAPHGNYPDWPWGRPYIEMHIRAVPNSRKYVATAAAHHGYELGSLVLIDPQVKDDRAMSQVKRITPEAPLAEAEINPAIPRNIPDIGQFRIKGTRMPDHCYATPWPLSEDFYLCAYDRSGWQHGLYLVDSFGNKVLIYRDPQIRCIDPIPLAPRRRPPVLPAGTRQMGADRTGPAEPTATVSVMNVYQSEMPWPAGTKIKALRVINIFPKDSTCIDRPNIGGSQALARGVLGTVPVEEDGSASFQMPAGVEVYFQALDERGCAVQTMMSGAFAHAGEHLACQGCHESKLESLPRPQNPPLALRRPPSKLQPEPAGSFPITFPRLVQPVLNARCLPCHSKEPKAPDLSPELFGEDPKCRLDSPSVDYIWLAISGVRTGMHGWSKAYASLFHHVWHKESFDYQENRFLRDHQYSIPGQVGARASRLLQMLDKEHHDVKLSPQEWRRLIVWMDCNSVFYGAYRECDKQARGELVLPRLGLPADWKERVAAVEAK